MFEILLRAGLVAFLVISLAFCWLVIEDMWK